MEKSIFRRIFCIICLIGVLIQPIFLPAVSKAELINNYEKFNFIKGDLMWTTSNMVVKNDILESDSRHSIAEASLKGTDDCYWCNFDANISMAITEDSGGWVMLRVRGSETFLLRRSGVWLYKDSREIFLGRYSKDLTDNIYYNYNIRAVEDKISLTVSDENSTYGTFSFTTDKIEKGNISVKTYSSRARIKEINVRGMDDGEVIKNSIIALEVGTTTKVSDLDTTLMWTSSDDKVATVDENGVVAALSPGNAIISAKEETGKIDCCSIVVYEVPEKLVFLNDITCIEQGETIGIRISKITPQKANNYLKWTSSDETILQITGNNYERKTFKAIKEGAAEVVIRNCNDEILYSNVITVIPKSDRYMSAAYATFGSDKTEIKPLIFGMHTPKTMSLTEFQHDVFNEMNFMYTRSYQMDPTTDGIYTLASEEGIPQMMGLDVVGKTTDELIMDVSAMWEGQGKPNVIYVELGNELYDTQFVFDKNGDGKTDANDYVKLCEPISKAIKAYAFEKGFEVKIGAVFVNDDLTGTGTSRYDTWNDIVSESSDFYDAIVIHHYTTFNNLDGLTADEVMQTMYANNQYFAEQTVELNTKFPDKEIWVTEYGTLIMDMFKQTLVSEQGRLQFGNSVGVAIVNIEKLLDMTVNGIVDMSSYHCFADTQGFGLVGDVYLPEYYTFKKIGEMLNKYSSIYPAEEIIANENLPRTHGRKYKDIGVWGFGNADGIEYAVISNRSENPIEFAIEGYSLKPEWSYGGGNILEGFLEEKKNMYVMPENIPEPEILNSQNGEKVILNGYSITVVKLTKNPSVKSVYINLSSNTFNPLNDILTCSGENIILYKEGVEEDIFITGTDVKTIKPVDGFKYGTIYTISVDGVERNFETISEPPFEKFEVVLDENFNYVPLKSLKDDWIYYSSDFRWANANDIESYNQISKWNQYETSPLLTKRSWEDFVLTFDLKPVDKTKGYLALDFRGSFLRFFFTGEIRSYFNGKNDVLVGVCPAYSSVLNVKVVTYNEYVYIWCSADGGEYKYCGKVEDVALGTTQIGFHGEQKYYLDNVVIKSGYTAISDISFNVGNEKCIVATPVIGENAITISIKPDYENALCMIAIYNGNKFKNLYTFTNDSTTINMEKGDMMKLFVWDSLNGIKPYQEVYIPLAIDFIKR